MDYRAVNYLNECIELCNKLLSYYQQNIEKQRECTDGELLAQLNIGEEESRKSVQRLKNRLINLRNKELQRIESNNL